MKVHICYDNIFLTLDVSGVEFKYMDEAKEKDGGRLEEFQENFFKHNWALMGATSLKQLKKD